MMLLELCGLSWLDSRVSPEGLPRPTDLRGIRVEEDFCGGDQVRLGRVRRGRIDHHQAFQRICVPDVGCGGGGVVGGSGSGVGGGGGCGAGNSDSVVMSLLL